MSNFTMIIFIKSTEMILELHQVLKNQTFEDVPLPKTIEFSMRMTRVSIYFVNQSALIDADAARMKEFVIPNVTGIMFASLVQINDIHCSFD